MSTRIHKFKNGPKKGTLCGRNIRSKKDNVTTCHEHKPKTKKEPIKTQPVNDQTEIIDVNDEIVETIFEKDPQLVEPENQILHQSLQAKNQGLSWDKIS